MVSSNGAVHTSSLGLNEVHNILGLHKGQVFSLGVCIVMTWPPSLEVHLSCMECMCVL